MNKRTIKTPGAILNIEGDIVKKKYYSHNQILYQTEMHWLKKLGSSPFIPELIEYSDDALSLTTRYSGEPISAENAPADWEKQLTDILFFLKQADCHHGDLLPQNLLVKNGKLRVIDFAFALSPSKNYETNNKIRTFSDAYAHDRLSQFIKGIPAGAEVHGFTVWDALDADDIEQELKKSLNIIDKITFSPLLYTEYCADRITWLEKFYDTNNTYGAKKGNRQFCTFVVVSENPVYERRGKIFDKGTSVVNTEIFDIKVRLRANRKNFLHASDNLEEARRNLKYLSRKERSLPFLYSEMSRPTFHSTSEIFSTLNDLKDVSYVLLRTPENRSEDYDILCDDYFAVKRALGGIAYKTHSKLLFRTVGDPVDEDGFKVAQYVKFQDDKIRFDIRYVGDGYYPRNWQKQILKNRVLRDGIYVCSKEDEFYGKAYHALFQKLNLPKKYQTYFGEELGLSGNKLERELRYMTLKFINNHNYPITRPKDLTMPYNPPELTDYATRREYYYVRRELRKNNFSGASKILINNFLIQSRKNKLRFYSWLTYILIKRTEVDVKQYLKKSKRQVQFKLDRIVRRLQMPSYSRSS